MIYLKSIAVLKCIFQGIAGIYFADYLGIQIKVLFVSDPNIISKLSKSTPD